MSSNKTNFGVYRDVATQRYQDTVHKNAKEEDSKSQNRLRVNQKS